MKLLQKARSGMLTNIIDNLEQNIRNCCLRTLQCREKSELPDCTHFIKLQNTTVEAKFTLVGHISIRLKTDVLLVIIYLCR
jgi:hypothetical protein